MKSKTCWKCKGKMLVTAIMRKVKPAIEPVEKKVRWECTKCDHYEVRIFTEGDSNGFGK